MNEKLPAVGAVVVTADGHRFGTVTAVAGDCFKVDKPMAVDKWLGFDVISSIDNADQDVRLSLSLEALDGEREGVEHMGYHVHHEN